MGAFLFIGGLCYCAGYRTQGFIPTAAVTRLVDLDDIYVLPPEPQIVPTPELALHRDLADRLVSVGLWERVPEGFLVHDFADWNDPRRRGGRVRAANAQRQGGRFTPPTETVPAVENLGKEAISAGAELVAQASSKDLDLVQDLKPLPEPPARDGAGDRQALFAALSAATGSQHGPMTRPEARATGVALSEIRHAMPEVTPEEVARRAALYRQHFPGASLTANALAKHWSRCGRAPQPVNGERSPEAERIFQEMLDQVAPPPSEWSR